MTSKQSPQEKILEAAQILFMDKGYHETSVRDIAKTAGVNVASINYYFNSKQSLCNDVLSIIYSQCEKSIQKIEEEYGHNILLLCEQIFNFLSEKNMKNYRFVIQAIFDGLVKPETISSEGKMIGPPGSYTLFRAIKKNLKTEVSDQTIYWGTRALYHHINHTIKINFMYKISNKNNDCDKQKILNGLKRLCRAILNDIDNYQDAFI